MDRRRKAAQFGRDAEHTCPAHRTCDGRLRRIMRLVKSYLAFAIVASVSACSPPPPQPPPPAAPAMSPVERGQYIVTTGLCNDCHTPAKMGPNGPEPDMDRLLSGHPETLKVTPTKA